MKILIHGDGVVVYGAERQAVLIAQGLRARGHEVVVSCPPASPFQDLLHERGVSTVHIRPRGNLDVLAALRFARWIRAEQPDAFLSTSWKRALVVGWAARLAGVHRIVLRVGAHKDPGTRSSEWRTRRALRAYTDALITSSATVNDFFAQQFPFFPGQERHVVWNAVEPQDTSGGMLRRELRIGTAPLILAVGGLSANKSQHLLLEALAKLPQRAAHLAVAGWGKQADALQQRTAELGLAERVHWLGHRTDVARLLGAADVFALTSRIEGTPSALLEAMAAGTAVISTPVGGSEISLAAVAGRPPAGWLVPFHDVEALAQTLQHVLEGRRAGAPEVLERLAEARWRAEHWFSVDRMVAGYEAVLRGGQRYDDALNFGLAEHASLAR